MKIGNLKILLIEDDPENESKILKILNKNKKIISTVNIANRLYKALDVLNNERFDIILIDIVLPDSNGLEAVHRLIKKNDTIPIIVLMGLDDKIIGDQAIVLGAQNYLVKSEIESSILDRTIQFAIKQKKKEEQLKKSNENLDTEIGYRTNELFQTEKMASLGQLVAGVAHEVNNPLAFMNSNSLYIDNTLEELNNYSKDEEYKELINKLRTLNKTNIKGIKRIASIIKTLKRFATPTANNFVIADINQGIQDTIMILNNQLRHRITIHEDYGDIPKIECNISQINQVFMNIVLNSSQAMAEGDIWIKTWIDIKNIYIEIKDNGSGITKETINRIFDPFFSTKDTGTGLGLSLCYRIIHDHGGDITVKSEVGKGTEMLIRLPCEV